MNARYIGVVVLAIWLAGCANLKDVKDYASESAKLTSYTELTAHFRDTYDREKPYLSTEADRIARENDKRRREAYRDLIQIQRHITSYMQTLAAVAGADSFDLSQETGALASGIKAYPEWGLDKKHVDAVANLIKVTGRWAPVYLQHKAVREMVKEADEPVQTSLEGLLALLHFYRETHENEQKTVLGFYEVEMLYADTPEEKLVLTLAREQVRAKKQEYAEIERKYTSLERGIKDIAEGHRQLASKIDKIKSSELNAAIGQLAKDIKIVRESLHILNEPSIDKNLSTLNH